MSDVLYPVSLIEKLVNEKFERSLADQFEDGSTSARRLWPAQYFKRRLSVLHSPLTEAEFRYLRSFYSQRHGRYDSFWFRDNVHREGNVKVRFANSLPMQFEGRARRLQVMLEEVEAIRALPEWDELAAAAGCTPVCWFDANRERYYSNAGTIVKPDAFAWDNLLTYPAPWQVGALPLGNSLGQYQHYAFEGTIWAKSGPVSELTTTSPAVTIFAIARHSTVAAKQFFFAIGAESNGGAMGLGVSADNYYRVYTGNTDEPSASKFYENNPQNTWRSLCVTWQDDGANSNYKNYVNGAFQNQASVAPPAAQNYAGGVISLGAAPAGSFISNPSGVLTNCNLAHAIIFPATLTADQVADVHNLLGYQYGLATV